jgi:hypothetical protein
MEVAQKIAFDTRIRRGREGERTRANGHFGKRFLLGAR